MIGTASETTRADSVDPGWAWAEYQPSDERPWTLARAGHLLRRATFGANWQALEQARQLGPQQTIDRLVQPAGDVAGFEQSMGNDERAVARGGGGSMRAWWLRRMLLTPHPLQEKMTLFWHGHFGVSQGRVNDPQALLRYIATLRSHALGSYRELLAAVTADAAVLLSAGAERSRKAQPNDSLIRQLMEHYSVGPGHYGDEDVREAARAFTGWAVLHGRLRFLAHEHDDGSKRVFGQTGPWQSQDVVRIVLDQPATPRWIARKLYRWLISELEEPPAPVLEPLATMLAGAYDVGEVVETILRSNLFFSDVAYRRRVKSPVDFSLGLAIGLESTLATQPLATALEQLGQNLFDPPTPRGWPGGVHWINAVTMLRREKLVQAMVAPQGPYGGALDPAKVAQQHRAATPREAAEWLLRLFVQEDVDADLPARLLAASPQGSVQQAAPWLRKVVQQIGALPEFQLA